MWKFKDFSVIQILREINFKESKSSESNLRVSFAILGTLNIVNLVNFSFLKVQKYMKSKFRTTLLNYISKGQILSFDFT